MIVGNARLMQAERKYLVKLEGDLKLGSGANITSDNSQMADTFILMDHRPTAAARQPPAKVLAALQALSTQLELGRKLRQCRQPDLLLETMGTQPAAMAMSWLHPILAQVTASCVVEISQLDQRFSWCVCRSRTL